MFVKNFGLLIWIVLFFVVKVDIDAVLIDLFTQENVVDLVSWDDIGLLPAHSLILILC